MKPEHEIYVSDVVRFRKFLSSTVRFAGPPESLLGESGVVTKVVRLRGEFGQSGKAYFVTFRKSIVQRLHVALRLAEVAPDSYGCSKNYRDWWLFFEPEVEYERKACKEELSR